MKDTVKNFFFYLENIAKFRGLISKHDLKKLIHAFISCRVDYCNGLFTGLPKKQNIKPTKPPFLQYAAARAAHISLILQILHWQIADGSL